MDDLFHSTIEIIEKKCKLRPVAIPPDLERISYPFGLLQLRYYNWASDRIRKMYAMRMKMKLFSLDILGIGIFPKTDYDVPIFIYDLSRVRKKVVTYINLVPLLNDTSFQENYIEPLQDVHSTYRHLPPYPKIADWFKKLLTPYTIYALPDVAYIEDAKKASFDYLSVYMDMLYNAQPLDNEERKKIVQDSQTAYFKNMFDNDSSRKMLARIIGTKRTNRIFQKILT